MISLFPVTRTTDGARHFSRRRLLSMTLFGSPLPFGHGSPKKL